MDDADDDCACCDHSKKPAAQKKSCGGKEYVCVDNGCLSADHGHGCGNGREKPTAADDCCGMDHGHGHDHQEIEMVGGHGHDHGHHVERLKPTDEDEDDCACCDHSQPAAAAKKSCGNSGDCSHDHATVDHGHGHGHDHHGSADDCCGGDHNHSHQVEDDCCGMDHGHGHGHIALKPVEQVLVALVADIENQAHSDAPIKLSVCNSCDPNSTVLHAVQVTRFRVANMCCAGEERLIRATLENVTGVEHIAINLVGRYVLIKHCPVDCCAPAQRIMDMLNALHLGVSIQDISDQQGAEDDESIDVKHTLHVGLVVALFLVGLGFYLSMGTLHEDSDWIFVTSIGIGIAPILYAACIALFIRHTLDIHLLMVVAIAGAVASKEYFDGSLLVALFLLAEYIEAVVVQRVRRAVSLSSGGTMPKEVFLASGKTVALVDLKVGDVLAVRAGELIVCDGIVTKGEGVVDESALTGEAAPVGKKVDSPVFSGTVVQNGYIEIRIDKNPQESTMARLSQAVAEVQADRGQYAKMIDSFAAYWTPAVLVATLVLVVVGGGVTGEWAVYTHRGLVLLVLACPCAIVISAPIPSLCAIASAAHSGVLIRGSTIIERMSTVDTIAVDKTGTLTKALFKVCDKASYSETDYDAMMITAAVESKSTHPLAHAIVSEYCGCIAEMDEQAFPAVRKLKVLDGVGVEAWVEMDGDWKYVLIGNERILHGHGGKVRLGKVEAAQLQAFQVSNVNKVVLLMAVEDELILSMALADELRPEAKQFIASMQGAGMTVDMLTGDHEQVAQDICAAVAIDPDHCHPRLLPEQKLQWIDQQQKEMGRRVLMIGDGINDSIALAASTIGVAMGAEGTAMAVAAADVVLMNDNLMLLPPALKLCRLAKRTIIENFTFAVAVKIAAIVLAIMGMLQFWEAVLVDIGSLIVVVINGTKVLRAGSGAAAAANAAAAKKA